MTVYSRFDKKSNAHRRESQVRGGAVCGESSPGLCVPKLSALLRVNTSYTATRILSPSNESTSGRASASNFSWVFLREVTKTLATQLRGMTKDFKSNGLPWKGEECRSIISGGSGVLYSLPALFCRSNGYEQCLWLIQAFLSVMADYVYIDRDSWIHGIDRYFALSNTVVLISRAALGLRAIYIINAVIPLFSFMLANKAKMQRNLNRWIYYHFLWHISGSITVALTVYLLYNCPVYDKRFSTDDYLLNQFCLNT